MLIRQTHIDELATVMQIYEVARASMREQGNASQWIDGYPSLSLIESEIEKGHSFVCIDEDGDIVCTFCLVEGEDPTYLKIYDGKWINNEPYATVHRLASSGKHKGVGEICFKWCIKHYANIRVDTHQNNKTMQHILEKLGFVYCGIIHVSNGSERLAYQIKNFA